MVLGNGDREGNLRLGIDASNLRAGGGITHLSELLHAAKPEAYGFRYIIVFGGDATLQKLEPRSWLRCISDPLLNGNLLQRLYWQFTQLDQILAQEKCDLLFVPGGVYLGGFRPFVVMSQNMLPFDWREVRRYGMSWSTIRFLLLRYAQSRAFDRADGLIFLTQYAYGAVSRHLGKKHSQIRIIPHGINPRFHQEPKPQRSLAAYSSNQPFRLLYVSTIAPYKHPWYVVQAVGELRANGYPIVIDFVGPAHAPSLKRFKTAISRWDSHGMFVRYTGQVSFAELHKVYHQADAFVFASSCESISFTLLEAMAAGLPIACSSRGPMPEILGEAGVYFDPEKPAEIAQVIQALLDDPNLRTEKAVLAYERARQFTWERCARETFSFLARIAEECRQT